MVVTVDGPDKNQPDVEEEMVQYSVISCNMNAYPNLTYRWFLKEDEEVVHEGQNLTLDSTVYVSLSSVGSLPLVSIVYLWFI